MAFWAAAQIHGRHERLALHCLGLAGFTTWLPRVRERRIIRGRRQHVLRPLFSNYLLIAIELQWHAVRCCPGVTRLVMDGLVPARVPDRVIEELKSREKNGVALLRAIGPEAQAVPEVGPTKSARNSDAGAMPVIKSRSRARVQAT